MYFPASVVTDYVDAPKDLNFAVLRSTFTIKFYLKPDSWAATYESYILYWGSAYTSNWAFRVSHNAARQIVVEFSTTGGALPTAGLDSNTYVFPADGEGIYIAITYRNSPSAGKLYVSPNNKDWTVVQALTFGTPKTLYDANSSFRIGGGVALGTDPGFKGYIGQVTINGAYDNLNSVTSDNWNINCNPATHKTGSTFACPIVSPYTSMTWTMNGNVSLLQV